MGLDIGGSLSKLVIVDPGSGSRTPAFMSGVLSFIKGRAEFGETGKRDEHLELRLDGGGVVHLIRFQTRRMAGAIALAKEQLDKGVAGGGGAPGEALGLQELNCTGGGARKFAPSFAKRAKLRLRPRDELTCLVRGLASLLTGPEAHGEAFSVDPDTGARKGIQVAAEGSVMYPLVLVNIGSGVSIVLVESATSWRRVSGTPIGGGCFYGLTNCLTGLSSFDEMLRLAAEGDHTRINLTVGDIYGDGEAVYGLRPDYVAASFGKPLAVNRRPQHGRREGERGPVAAGPGLSPVVAGDADDADGAADAASTGAASSARAASPGGLGGAGSLGDSSSMESEIHGVRLGPIVSGDGAAFGPDGRFRARREDFCAAALVLVTDQVAQAAVLTAQRHGVPRVFFAGSFLRHDAGSDAPQRRLAWAVQEWSGGAHQAVFLRREGYYGALGALLEGGRESAAAVP